MSGLNTAVTKNSEKWKNESEHEYKLHWSCCGRRYTRVAVVAVGIFVVAVGHHVAVGLGEKQEGAEGAGNGRRVGSSAVGLVHTQGARGTRKRNQRG